MGRGEGPGSLPPHGLRGQPLPEGYPSLPPAGFGATGRAEVYEVPFRLVLQSFIGENRRSQVVEGELALAGWEGAR